MKVCAGRDAVLACKESVVNAIPGGSHGLLVLLCLVLLFFFPTKKAKTAPHRPDTGAAAGCKTGCSWSGFYSDTIPPPSYVREGKSFSLTALTNCVCASLLVLLNGNFVRLATLTLPVVNTVFPPRSRDFVQCCVDFSALVVIPSILNLTSSHTRDEVIAESARHVHRALIGWSKSKGRCKRKTRN